MQRGGAAGAGDRVRAPMVPANSFSKRSTNGPTEETYRLSRHSRTYRTSLPSNNGSASGIIL